MPETCASCENEAIAFCRKCTEPMCNIHRSSVDDDLCANCTNGDVGFRQEPLLDDEGVEHKGKHIVITGPIWQTNAAIIAGLSDTELENHIESFRKLVNEAEKSTEYRRIKLAMLEFEKGDRKRARRRALAKQKMPVFRIKTGEVVPKAEQELRAQQKLSDTLKASGLKPEQVVELLKAALATKVAKP